MFSEKVPIEFTNAEYSFHPLLRLARLEIHSSLANRCFELDIESDAMRKPLSINHETS